MKRNLLILFTLLLFYVSSSHAQNAPFSLWGSGLDGSLYQQSVFYSDATNGLLMEAPLNSSGAKLPITLSWRGGGPGFTINPSGNVGIGTATPLWLLHLRSTTPVINLEKAGILNWSIGNLTGNNFTIMPDSYSGSINTFNINSTGNIGIGTTNPIGNLDVRGASFVGTSDLSIGSTGSMIQIDQGASSGNTY